jgi:peptidoglycan/LPS O-acetylase OafA/YrhL
MTLQKHIPQLDGVRGLAILAVMLHHFTILQPQTPFEHFFTALAHKGGHGVDLFFVLSGFLITGILLDSKGQPGYFQKFYMRRTLRIFPLYYAVTTLLLWVMPGILGSAQEIKTDLVAAQTHWPWYYFYVSNFWIFIKGFYYRGGIDISWSLAIEEQFYLFWPWLVLQLRPSHLAKTCCGFIALAFLCRLGLAVMGYNTIQIDVFTLSRMDGLAWGALLSILLRSPQSYALNGFLTLPFLAVELLAAILLFLGKFSGLEPFFFSSLGYSLLTLSCAQILLIALQAPKQAAIHRLFSSKLLTFFGKYSYAMYLFHIPCGSLVRRFLSAESFQTLPGNPLLWQFLYYLLGIFCVIPLALLSWNLLEKPALSLKKYFTSNTPPPSSFSF